MRRTFCQRLLMIGWRECMREIVLRAARSDKRLIYQPIIRKTHVSPSRKEASVELSLSTLVCI